MSEKSTTKEVKPKVKLLICYHKKAELYKDEVLTPIHVGRALAEKNMDHASENYKWLMANMIGDNTGDNISNKNDSYNEMTALYWAWKNYEKLGNPDYIGLMHYRRHFVFRESNQIVENIRNYNKDIYFDIINYSEEHVREFVEGCDFVTHIGRVQNVYNHFIENQRKTDIDLVNKIVLEKYPEYKAVMDEYYAGNDSNFCNMTIFSKKIFFDYCEWIFTILKEFEKRVDITEKRFFISERLSGIFIANLMKDENMKYKVLPIAFIDEPVEVQIAMYLEKQNKQDVAMTITSIMETSENYHSYHFYIFNNLEGEEQSEFKIFEKKYTSCKIDFIQTGIPEDYISLYASDLLPNVNKCIYITGKVIAMFDIGEFYHVSSVDDYYAIGIPCEQYKPEEEDKEIETVLMVLNCKRIRKHKIINNIVRDKEGKSELNRLFKNEIGYIPWYYYTSERYSNLGNKLFSKEKSRNQIQSECLWRPFLIYDCMNPIENNQGVYSIFWWNYMKKLPLQFQHIEYNKYVLKNLYRLQQIEMNNVKDNSNTEDSIKENSNTDSSNTENREEWRDYGLWAKLVFYYKHNGLKNTIRYVIAKIFRRV